MLVRTWERKSVRVRACACVCAHMRVHILFNTRTHTHTLSSDRALPRLTDGRTWRRRSRGTLLRSSRSIIGSTPPPETLSGPRLLMETNSGANMSSRATICRGMWKRNLKRSVLVPISQTAIMQRKAPPSVLRYDKCVKRDRSIWKKTYKRDLRKRPAQGTYNKDVYWLSLGIQVRDIVVDSHKFSFVVLFFMFVGLVWHFSRASVQWSSPRDFLAVQVYVWFRFL
jgi:hypothetical protein